MKRKRVIANSNWNKNKAFKDVKRKKRVRKMDEKKAKSDKGAQEEPEEGGSDNYSVTKILAIDCEMVGTGRTGKSSMLARVCIVNYFGNVIYDEYAKPKEKITDFRTHVSGIEPKHLVNAKEFEIVQKEVFDIVNNNILIGHSIKNDLKALLLTHPSHLIRDTAKYRPFQRIKKYNYNPHTRYRPRKLKHLAKFYLEMEIQSGEHSPYEDALAALLLYKKHSKDWERSLKFNKKR